MANDSKTINSLPLLALADRQHQTVTRVQQSLAHQRSELQRLRVAFQEAWLDVAGQVDDSGNLHTENQQLRTLLAERDRQHGVSVKLAKEQEETLLAELEALRLKLQEKDARIEELRAGPARLAAGSVEEEIAAYEAELNEYRLQLEKERQAFDEELKQLRLRQADVTETARQAELELSRERAQLARERIHLDRLREEIRQELERAERHAEVEELLAPVQRLQEEMTERHRQIDPCTATPMPPARGKVSSGRLRTIRGRLNENKT
jgi:chromosome segregation ATPase